MNMIAIIPARGGSKRIERKNVKEFCGIPVIAYSIRAALAAGCFRHVIVSTDDEEIARVAAEYGAEVPFMRSTETADDFATTADVLREVLGSCRAMGMECEAFCCIYATAPFITPQRLREGAAIIGEGRGEAAFTCVAYSYPTQRCLVIGEGGKIGMKYPQFANSRSQDLEPTYHDAGQFYFSTVEAFERTGSLWGPDTLPIVLPELEVQDLDTPVDWQLAEMKYRLLSAWPGTFTTGHYRFVSYPLLPVTAHRRLLEERNDPEVRCRMVNTHEISWESHLGFVNALAGRDDCRYYAVFDVADGSLAGSVNFHIVNDPDAPEAVVERGIWIAAGKRGRGEAKRMLSEAYDELWAGNVVLARPVSEIITKVRKDNAASLALEASLEAERRSADDEYIYFTLPNRRNQ